MQNAFIETSMEKKTPHRTKIENIKEILRCLASYSISHAASEQLSVSFIRQFLDTCYSFWGQKELGTWWSISSLKRWTSDDQNRIIYLMAPNQHSIVTNCVIDSIRCDSFPLAKTNLLIPLEKKWKQNLIVALEFRNFSTFFSFTPFPLGELGIG